MKNIVFKELKEYDCFLIGILPDLLCLATSLPFTLPCFPFLFHAFPWISYWHFLASSRLRLALAQHTSLGWHFFCCSLPNVWLS